MWQLTCGDCARTTCRLCNCVTPVVGNWNGFALTIVGHRLPQFTASLPPTPCPCKAEAQHHRKLAEGRGAEHAQQITTTKSRRASKHMPRTARPKQSTCCHAVRWKPAACCTVDSRNTDFCTHHKQVLVQRRTTANSSRPIRWRTRPTHGTQARARAALPCPAAVVSQAMQILSATCCRQSVLRSSA